jgi:hypothetical protein
MNTMPTARIGRPRNEASIAGALRRMAIGDSAFHPMRSASITGVCSWVRIQTGARFATHLVVEDGVPGVRIRRIS